MRSVVVVVGLLTFLAGCPSAASYVVLVVDAQPMARTAAASLRVRIASADGTLRREDTLPLTGTSFPVRIPLTPAGGDATRGWIVDATLLDSGGLELTGARARGGYEAGATREASLCLYSACAGVDCGPCDAAGCDTCRGASCSSAVVTLGPPGSAARCPDSCAASETACADGADDDCDGMTDCADPECGCLDAGPGFDAGPACPGFALENTVTLCHDGLDNDCDGVRDCAEGPDCRIAEGPSGCRNALDDDCDGMIDCAELGCAMQACGPGGDRCCGGACVDTYGDEGNCGACGLACDPARICVRVPDALGGLAGAACRCGVTADCARGAVCESHDGTMLCNCVVDGDCTGGATCRRQGAAHHTYCGY